MSFKKQYKNIKLYFSFSLLEKMNIQPNFYYLSMDDIDLNLNLSSLLLFESDGYMSESTESFEDPDSDYDPDSTDNDSDYDI
jgi:hypothetical protein